MHSVPTLSVLGSIRNANISFPKDVMKYAMFSRTRNQWHSKPTDQQIECKILDDALDFAQRPPIQSDLTPLQRPVGISRLESGASAPFARLYAPELKQYDLPQEEFVDNMNIVCTDFVFLQILDAVGSLVGLLSNHWTQLVGAVTSLGSRVTVHALSKLRGEMFLQCANAEYFNP